jgi:hypothetical protein
MTTILVNTAAIAIIPGSIMDKLILTVGVELLQPARQGFLKHEYSNLPEGMEGK